MSSQNCKKRPDWDEYFMNIAQLAATRATCDRGADLKYMPGFKGVGAVIVKDRVILATGYNGSPRGLEHCDDVGHELSDGHCIRTVHAEANALASAAKHGVAIDGGTVYTTASPCYDCFKLLVNAGITRIVCGAFYGSRYGASEKVMTMAAQAGIKFEFIKNEPEPVSKSEEPSLPLPIAEIAAVQDNAQDNPVAQVKLKIKKIHPSAVMPSYTKAGDAGLDLSAVEGGEIQPQSRAKFGTGVAFEIPAGYVGLIWDRSGMSTKKGVKTLGGVIDSGYRGEIVVALANVSDVPVQIMKGDKIAQILIQKIETAQIEISNELSETQRGETGFGSSDEPQQSNENNYQQITEVDQDEQKSRW